MTWIYGKDLETLFSHTYFLAKYASFSPIYIDSLPPADRFTYVQYVIERLKKQNKN